MSKTELRFVPTRELRVATEPDGTKTLTGYAIVFGVRSLPLGGFVEVVAPEAVRQTLSGKPDILMLNNHNTSQVLSRTSSGTLTLTTDSAGVRFSCSLDTRCTYANDLAIAVERGDTRGCSFGFQMRKDAWQKEDGTLVRTLQQIDLSEISICSSPAYPQTAVSIRSCPSDLRKLLTRDLEDDDGECDCDCPECLAGDCFDCSNSECDGDEDDCEHGENSARSVDLWKLEMRLAFAQRL